MALEARAYVRDPATGEVGRKARIYSHAPIDPDRPNRIFLWQSQAYVWRGDLEVEVISQEEYEEVQRAWALQHRAQV